MLANTGDFVSCPDAPGAEINPEGSPFELNRCRLNVGKPFTPGVLFGVTYSISKAQRFSAKITSDSQFRTSLFDTFLLLNNNVI